MTLSVEEIAYSEWLTFIDLFEHTNLLQFWQYGSAKGAWTRSKVIRVVVKDDGNIISMIQLLVFELPAIGGLVRINRGPLLNKNIPKSQKISISIDIINAIVGFSKLKRWWFMRIAPDLLDLDIVNKSLSVIGMKKLSIPSFILRYYPTSNTSGVLSLDCDRDNLLMNLRGKWRNCLRKGYKLDVIVTRITGDSHELESLIVNYKNLQNKNRFSGISDSLITSLAKESGHGWEFNLFIAKEKSKAEIEESIGMLVCIKHGDTATYLIGETNDAGRKMQANYVLLWEAILYSKESGAKWFDIGGLDTTSTKGVAHFKRGINSDLYNLTGEWYKIILPWS